ncbi:ABC transporter ATP-binding protein [Acetonema longum]|uniref:ABC transporter related protein n=1 Tax=Acetonema longum DSM 6540 TaxID=1009370 RepID=F7NQF9_9FIRM|nr:ABC transporter ATP-binding protein [Acetonema longum]EGO61737.1 ABC transporter related protein [Acetonema longum DSM 6540]
MAEVKIESVTKLFGEVKAVNAFSALIRNGEFLSILGPSGCGKTTMLRMIAGFEKANSGEIYIGDHLVSSPEKKIFAPPEKRNIGMVFQSYAVWPHMSVFDNVAYPLKIKGIAKDIIREKTLQALDMVHLDGYADRLPSQLSGGQQQRVALARALVSEPQLLLLDEPLSNLDAKLRESMRFEIKELQKKLNVTVVYVTHDQAEAMAMSDRIVVMHQGVIQQIGSPLEVYETPANRVIADFIGLVNFIDAEARQDTVHIPSLGLTLPSQHDFSGKAVAAIRPEYISLTQDEQAVQGTIVHKVYLGDAVDWRIDVNGAQIRVIDKAAALSQYSSGDRVGLEFKKVMVFPE